MSQVKGVVERITYADVDSGYSVIKIKSKGANNLITIVGNMSSVNVGAVVTINGTWVNNPKFGKQFQADGWSEEIPATLTGMEKYLSGGLIKGIGPKFAKLIVDYFKEDTFDIIENNPERLTELDNIGKIRANRISEAWKEQKEIKNLMLFLQEFDVSTAFGVKIYRQYGDDSIGIIKENPYKLADDIWGIGFKTADSIALKMGIDKESYNRCRSGLFYVLNKFADNGHCYAKIDELIEKAVEILEIEEPKIIMTISNLIQIKELFNEDDTKIFLPPFYYSEHGCARIIKNIIKTSNKNKITDVDKAIKNIEKISNITYDEVQKNAIKLAVSNKFCIITGGPGTGKTTISKAIIDIFKNAGKKVLLAAPTGRAAKRMTETCGLEAKTIHRLLGGSPIGGFLFNSENQLNGDILIVNESSMIDVLLMYNLMKAVREDMNVIIMYSDKR